jgi:hypothetical protein
MGLRRRRTQRDHQAARVQLLACCGASSSAGGDTAPAARRPTVGRDWRLRRPAPSIVIRTPSPRTLLTVGDKPALRDHPGRSDMHLRRSAHAHGVRLGTSAAHEPPARSVCQDFGLRVSAPAHLRRAAATLAPTFANPASVSLTLG